MQESLQTFLKLLIIKKQQKINRIIHKIISFIKKKGKRKSPIFWIRPGQTRLW